MKKVFIIVLLLSVMPSLFAQDIITTIEGVDISAKILEVSTDKVTYKKTSNPDGPTYTMLKSDILIIRYENGENDIFNIRTTSNTLNTTKPIKIGMNYGEYKDFYDTKNYVHQAGDPYSVGWAGVASLFIPGLGQWITGEGGRGTAFFLSNLALQGTFIYLTRYYDGYGKRRDYATYGGYAALGLSVVLNIISICDAVHVAKIKNMYYQDIRSQQASYNFKIEPFFAFTPTFSSNENKPAAGISLRLTF